MNKILNKFKNVSKRNDHQYQALCPAHNDTNPSLSIKIGNGRILLYCQAGCKYEDIIKAAGINRKDLNLSSDRAEAGCTLKQYSKHKRIPVKYLKSTIKAKDGEYYSGTCVLFPYFDAAHQKTGTRIRTALTGSKKFRWEKGSKLYLYGLWRPDNFNKNSVFLVEGESDCHTLWYKDVPALGVPGANNWKDDRDAQHFTKFKTVYFIYEPDQGGKILLKSLKHSKVASKIKVIKLNDFKDISEMYLSNPDLFKKRLKNAMENAKSLPQFSPDTRWTTEAVLEWIEEVGEQGKNLDGWIEKTRDLTNAETDIILKAVSKKTGIGVRALKNDLKEKQEEWQRIKEEDAINPGSEEKQIIVYDKTSTIEAVEKTSEALINSENLYRYGSSYVSVISKNPESVEEVKRDLTENKDSSGKLFITPHTVETLRHEIEKVAYFVDFDKSGNPRGILVPNLVIKGLMSVQNAYDKPLTGIIEHPYIDDAFKPVIQKGYDSRTGLYCNFPDELIFDYKTIPSVIRAQKAYSDLCNKVLPDFPFAEEIDKVAAVSMFLTALQRKMISGDSGCPGYEIDAPTQATGKTTLARTVCYAIYNRLIPVTSWASNDDEIGKHLLSILKEGHPCVLFDNLPEGITLCSDELSKAMTSPTYSKRQLGINKTVTVPSQVLWLFTGNNVQIVGDFNTRVLQIRLDAKMEDPDKRRFKRPDIGGWCRKNRKQIIKSCMVIIVASKDYKCDLKPSRFQEWDKFVRFPLYQVTGVDIAEVFDRNKLTDPKIEGQRTFLKCWYNLYSDSEMTVKEVLQDIDATDYHPSGKQKELGDAIKDIFNGGLPSSRGLGKWLGTLKGRIIRGYRMDSVKGKGRQNQNRNCWQVTEIPKSTS